MAAGYAACADEEEQCCKKLRRCVGRNRPAGEDRRFYLWTLDGGFENQTKSLDRCSASRTKWKPWWGPLLSYLSSLGLVSFPLAIAAAATEMSSKMTLLWHKGKLQLKWAPMACLNAGSCGFILYVWLFLGWTWHKIKMQWNIQYLIENGKVSPPERNLTTLNVSLLSGLLCNKGSLRFFSVNRPSHWNFYHVDQDDISNFAIFQWYISNYIFYQILKIPSIRLSVQERRLFFQITFGMRKRRQNAGSLAAQGSSPFATPSYIRPWVFFRLSRLSCDTPFLPLSPYLSKPLL